MLGPILFNTLISDRDEEAECALSGFADSMKLRGVADTPEGHAAIQRNTHLLGRLEKGADRNFVKFSKEVRRPAAGEERPQAPVKAGGQPVGKQLSRRGPRGPRGQPMDREPAMAS